MRCAVFLATLSFAAPASAFHHHGQFQGNADGRDPVPGSGGLYYTGSRRDLGLRCSACHVDAPGSIRADVTFSPALGAGDRYTPGTRYDVTVTMSGERAGLGACTNMRVNRNGYTAMVTDASGSPVGTLASESGARSCGQRSVNTNETSVVFGDCEGVVGVQAGARSLTAWTFRWTAPSSGGGALSLWLGVVDGDCVFDAYNDDVFETTLAMTEASARVEAEMRARWAWRVRRRPAVWLRRREAWRV